MIHTTIRLFPLWAILGSLAAWAFPEALTPLQPAIVPLLGLVMFGMGMTLTGKDFLEVVKRPGVVLLGASMQYLLMPLFAWLAAWVLALPPQLTAGLVLVGAAPGGTASNVICYLAKGNVALSITLTSVSTALAVFATPFLTWLYVGREVPVPVLGMFFSILKIVILPVALGVTVNSYWGGRLHRYKQVFPGISVLTIVIIIAIIVALNRNHLEEVAWGVTAAVILHNFLGLNAGYFISRVVGFNERDSRTLAIEVGMQNSGLGVALATQHFSALAALPGALFSIWHNLSGSALAAYWSRKKETNAKAPSR